MARLGELERAVMDVLWDAGDDQERTGREVLGALAGRDLAYTTVLTVLERLERKGFLTRARTGRVYGYRPTSRREDVVAQAMLEALGAAEDRDAALVRFVSSVTEEEAAALRRALEQAPSSS